MTRLEDRQILVRDIEQACAEGARLTPACALAGIDARTLRRWKAGDGLKQGDRRPDAERPVPPHALSEAERARIIALVNEPRFADTPPARIVPALADEGIYIGSESSFHRVLREHGQMNRRGRAQPPRASRPPTTHIATGPGNVWCWDVTFLPTQIQGRWLYFYLIIDLYSRKIVGWSMSERIDTPLVLNALDMALLHRAPPANLLFHSDRGVQYASGDFRQALSQAGLVASMSRKGNCYDNATMESFWSTLKLELVYRRLFQTRAQARNQIFDYIEVFYNRQRTHSALDYNSPVDFETLNN